ncbi:carbamoyltransferase HypF [Desulfatiglans anilini]|uniref:carbamoyltransferase HypF n=1 Tax=Desulfatiglans anilini TaxID=90728 RepID=UPI000418C5B7|nr:carbamoyltransferase HypF [Desulfatiglans anilini]
MPAGPRWNEMIERVKGSIRGTVQGVGFRPFIYTLARRHGLSGYVRNSPDGVEVEVEGPLVGIERFFEEVEAQPPPLARIETVIRRPMPSWGDKRFVIRESLPRGEKDALIPPDVCVCSTCLAEMRDPADRRHRYPFINCTFCGPRYTIVKEVPYDRPGTTMAGFPLCEACRLEYEDPLDRRFHAEPIACPECGPRVSLCDAAGRPLEGEDPLSAACSLIESGHILAVKGLGGFHLAADAAQDEALKRLRSRKRRDGKPFALMVKDLAAARRIAVFNQAEARCLSSLERPIVLLRKRRGHGLSDEVAPRSRLFGVMLPYTPLHALLMEGRFPALVMTSGNRSGEPIQIDNGEALRDLADVADGFLLHNRDIHIHCDDSILRVVAGSPSPMRRSRGFVPGPVHLPEALKDLPPVLAVGAEQKSTVCLTKGGRAFLSQHIGDLHNLETLRVFERTISHLEGLLGVQPQVLARDLHPDYLSSVFARARTGCPVVPVQHHHAHIVSCLAEHGFEGPVIGLAMDGTGYGPDGTIWGGEILLADWVSFERAGHLEGVPLPGGDAAVRHPWRMALAYLDQVFGDGLFGLKIPLLDELDPGQVELVLQMCRTGLNAPPTSSCGRFFDAAAALIGLRRSVTYEGQAAFELEMCQSRTKTKGYPWRVSPLDDGSWLLEAGPIITALVEDLAAGKPAGIMSRRFHLALIEMLSEVCRGIREQTGLSVVALSGGVFQNATLLEGLTGLLERGGFTVLSHRLVPCNDGGLSLGQAVCVALQTTGWSGRFAGGDHQAGSGAVACGGRWGRTT